MARLSRENGGNANGEESNGKRTGSIDGREKPLVSGQTKNQFQPADPPVWFALQLCLG